MTPKISEQYFRSLLAHPDSLEATSTISGFWSHRVDEAKPMFGLSRPEYHCQLVLIYTGEVGNGGHSQFFLNRGHDLVDDHVAALDTILSPYLASTLRKAAGIRADTEGLHTLDQQAWPHMSKADQALQMFLRENSEHVLQQERSL